MQVYINIRSLLMLTFTFYLFNVLLYGIFMEVGIGMREGKIMATGSKRGSSADCGCYVVEEEGDVGSGLC